MKTFIARIKKVRASIREISFSEIGYKKVIPSLLGAILITIIAMIPFILIDVELLKQFPSIIWFYHVILAGIFISILLIVPFGTMLFYSILKNYTQKEEVQNLAIKDVFLSELLNPIYLILAVMFIAILKGFLG